MIKALSNFVLISFLTFISFFIHTQLRIEVTQGIKDPIRIAVTPITWNLESPASHYIHQIISSDLSSFGEFDAIGTSEMLSLPQSEADIYYLPHCDPCIRGCLLCCASLLDPFLK